jgi:hypothetical protein
MVHALSPDEPRATGATRTVRGLQADSLACTRTVRYPYTDGLTNHLHQNFDTPKDLRELTRIGRTCEEHIPRGQSAAYRRTVHQARIEQLELQIAKSTSPTHPWISQTALALEERFGGDMKRP